MLPLCLPLHSPKEPNAKPRGAECKTGAECETPCFKNFGGSADFEVNLWALKEETDGIFLSYAVVQGTPSVHYGASKELGKSRFAKSAQK